LRGSWACGRSPGLRGGRGVCGRSPGLRRLPSVHADLFRPRNSIDSWPRRLDSRTSGSTRTSMADGVGVAPPARAAWHRNAAAPVFDRLATEYRIRAPRLRWWECGGRTLVARKAPPAGGRLFQSVGSVEPIGAGDPIDTWARVAGSGARNLPRDVGPETPGENTPGLGEVSAFCGRFLCLWEVSMLVGGFCACGRFLCLREVPALAGGPRAWGEVPGGDRSRRFIRLSDRSGGLPWSLCGLGGDSGAFREGTRRPCLVPTAG
jgi:hypothetical protein